MQMYPNNNQNQYDGLQMQHHCCHYLNATPCLQHRHYYRHP